MPIFIPNTTILAPHAIVPSSGAISQRGLAREKIWDNYSSTGTPPGSIYMADLVSGGNSAGSGHSYETTNTNSTFYPNTATPHAFSEWRGYDHDFVPSPSSYITAVHYIQNDNSTYSTNHNVIAMTVSSTVNQYHAAQSKTMGAIKFVLSGSQPYSIKAQLTQGYCYFYSGQPYGYWFHWWPQGSEFTQSSSTALYAYIYTRTSYGCSTTGGTYNWNTTNDFTISVSFKLRFSGFSTYTYRTVYMHLNTT